MNLLGYDRNPWDRFETKPVLNTERRNHDYIFDLVKKICKDFETIHKSEEIFIDVKEENGGSSYLQGIHICMERTLNNLVSGDCRRFAQNMIIHWDFLDSCKDIVVFINNTLDRMYSDLHEKVVEFWKRFTNSVYGIVNDVDTLRRTVERNDIKEGIRMRRKFEIKDVIFNGPATIVFWGDGTKTVVKCGEGDTFDKEKGLAMALAKKVWGTNESGSNFNKVFNKWLNKEE